MVFKVDLKLYIFCMCCSFALCLVVVLDEELVLSRMFLELRCFDVQLICVLFPPPAIENSFYNLKEVFT